MTQRFDASLSCAHATLLSQVVGQMQAGVPYTPSASDLAALGDLAGAINYWAAQPGACGSTPPPPGDFCTADDLRVSIFWGDYTRYETRNMGAFGRNTLCVTFPMQGSWSTAGYVSLAEYGGHPTARQMTISRTACDFRPVDPLGVNGPLAVSYGKQVTLYFNSQGADANLTPGQYFVNVRNWDPATNDWSVPADGDAPAGISIIWPHN